MCLCSINQGYPNCLKTGRVTLYQSFSGPGRMILIKYLDNLYPEVGVLTKFRKASRGEKCLAKRILTVTNPQLAINSRNKLII